jgi:hypothetical protein
VPPACLARTPERRKNSHWFGGSYGESRSKALWLLGYPVAALADVDQALKHGESGHAALLAWALMGSFLIVDSYCGNYATADRRVDELFTLAEEKDAVFWRAWGKGKLLEGLCADARSFFSSRPARCTP